MGGGAPFATREAPPSPDALREGDPIGIARCPTASMVDIYGGRLPGRPSPSTAETDRCIARRHDVIVVLGCPANDDGTPSGCQKRRADIAVALMNAGLGSHFITSGGPVENSYVEADMLRDLLIARGVPKGRIITEPYADTTDESIYYSTKLMEALGYASAIIVSDDPSHLAMSALCDSNCCVRPRPTHALPVHDAERPRPGRPLRALPVGRTGDHRGVHSDPGRVQVHVREHVEAKGLHLQLQALSLRLRRPARGSTPITSPTHGGRMANVVQVDGKGKAHS